MSETSERLEPGTPSPGGSGSPQPFDESQQQLVSILEHAPIVLFALDEDGTFLLSKGRGLEALGLKPGQVVGHSVFDLYADQPDVVASVRRALAGESFSVDSQVGELCYEVRYLPRITPDGKRRGTIGVAIDVTDRVDASRQRDRLAARIRQTQKLDALGTLAGGIAHDFNNILATIFGNTQLAMADTVDRQETQRNLREILQAARRAKELVQQILAFSGEDGRELEKVDVQSLVSDSAHLLAPSLPRNVTVDTRLSAEGATVVADSAQLHQVVVNVCTNAAYAMREKGGTLRISLEVAESPAAISDLPPGRYVELRIEDEGYGMDAATLARAFDPFFSTKREGDGAGMGLAMVYGIVTDHGGRISIDSRVEEGTTVRVWLPLLDENVKEASADVSNGFDRGRILLVDNDPAIVRVSVKMLETLGYDVEGCTGGREGWEAFSANPGAFDVVVADLNMPDLGGRDLASRIRERRPEQPIVFCTGRTDDVAEELESEDGTLTVLRKPMTIEDLGGAVRKAQGG